MKFLLLLILTTFSLNAETIAIFTAKADGATPWDPDSIRSGITGAEEAVIYISQKLAMLGHQVIVFGDPPMDSPHSQPKANPRYLRLDRNHMPKLDVAISWRMPEIASLLKMWAKKVYLWPHDVSQTKLTADQISGFDDVLWLTEWQRKQWNTVNPGFQKFTKVFGNGIVPEQFKQVNQRENPYSCIYGSNYGRGLELLLDIWPRVKKKFPKATLDIYYGWQHWGLLSAEKGTKIKAQIAELQSLDVKEHGLVGHEELNRAYEKASFWTYPCTGEETFCITALRAQFAGAIPVIISGSGLGETVRHGYRSYEREQYFKLLVKAMEGAEKISINERKKMRDFVLENYTWEVIAFKWNELFFRSDKSKNPTDTIKNSFEFHSRAPYSSKSESP